MAQLVAMEMLLSWQQENFTTAQQNESISAPYLVQMFFVKIHITDLAGCYGKGGVTKHFYRSNYSLTDVTVVPLETMHNQ